MKPIFLFLFAFTISFSGNSQILIKKVPDKLVVFTFDDATESQYSVVAPLLKKHGFGATFFVCEIPPNFNDKSKYMSWQQIKELDEMGFEVANHTKNHPAVSRLPEVKFLEELNYIENKCDSLGIGKPNSFAYPGYDLSLSVMDILQKQGYKYARAGGSRAYDPQSDYPLLIPSWAANSENKHQILAAFNEAKDGKIPVITFHGVPDLEHPWVDTPPALFKEYLQYLSDNHFKVISLKELDNYINVKKAMKELVPDLNKKYKN